MRLNRTVALVSLVAGVAAAIPAVAESLNAENARAFIAGKFFSYTCFEGTRGAGRINPDGSVAGTIQFQGSGPVRHVRLPANTLQVKGEAYCASVRGVPFQPCFRVTKTNDASFRGAISGMSFAYCDFKRHNPRRLLTHTARRRGPLPIQSAAAGAPGQSND
jgi:hypothetical protein